MNFGFKCSGLGFYSPDLPALNPKPNTLNLNRYQDFGLEDFVLFGACGRKVGGASCGECLGSLFWGLTSLGVKGFSV